MFTSTVGKTFLREYNRRNNSSFSAKEFFDKVLFKLFFDDKKYLFWAQNSPFVQGVSKTKDGILGLRDKVKNSEGNTQYFDDEASLEKMTKKLSKDSSILNFRIKKRKRTGQSSIEILKELSPKIRKEKLDLFHRKISDGERDASIAIGYPASAVEKFATTSGLVTDLNPPISREDVYYSWIGAMLSLGVGAYAILFNNAEITYATFEGWKVYRNFLNHAANEKLPANKIITWNGQWLAYRFHKWFKEDFDFNDFVRRGTIEVNKKNNTIEIKTIEWSQLFFSLSNQFPLHSEIGYVASIGDTNKTIGFIPFQLKSGRKLYDIYKKLFGNENFLKDADAFEALLGKHIKRACELGNIGLQALEPKNLRKYFNSSSNLKLIPPKRARKKREVEEKYRKRLRDAEEKYEENIITFRTYKTWLIAMITKNKEEISDYTQEIAEALVKYREGARKRDRSNLLEKRLFATKQKKQFLEALIDIVSDPSVDIDIVKKMKGLRDKIHFMSNEDFIYFVLLLKFDYAYQERIS